MSMTLQDVLSAYAAMGRPNMPPNDAGVQFWLTQTNAGVRDIWEAAASDTYFNDPQWHQVAQLARDLLANPANGIGNIIISNSAVNTVAATMMKNPMMLAALGFLAWKIIR